MPNVQPEYLVTGATGGIGYSVVNELLERGHAARILVRNRNKANRLFKENPLLSIVEGDVKNSGALKEAARGTRVLFHGVNYPYNMWEKNMEEVTGNIIEAAAASRATILFPGNVYNFGIPDMPIKEDTPPNPIARKGEIRVGLEKMLQEAAVQDRCRVIIVRAADFWGPNIINGLMDPNFVNPLKKKGFRWVGKTDIPHQLTYTPDLAKLFVRLSREEGLNAFEVFNYGSAVVPSIKSWFEMIAQETGAPLRIQSLSKLMISGIGLFVPVLRELKEMFYLFENSVVLDDTKIKSFYPDFKPTVMTGAIRHTLAWFKARNLGKV